MSRTTNFRTKLRRHRERLASEPGLRRNVVVLASLVVIAGLAGGYILGNQRFSPPWADHLELKAEFEAAPGISPGNGQEVRISGVIVGTISGAEVNDKGRAQLDLQLEPDAKVYDNATLVLRPKSPLNEMYVTIDPGGPPGKLLEDGATLPVGNTRRPIQVDEVLGSLDDQALDGLTSLLSEADTALASASTTLPGGLDAGSALLEDLQPVVAQLDQRRDALRRLVTAVSDISSAVGDNDERLASLAASLESTIGSLADESGPLGQSLEELSPLVDQLNASTAAVQELTQAVDPTLRDVQKASEELPDALGKLADTADTLSSTVEIATPVVDAARPLVADLRPVVADLQVGVPALANATGRLDPMTSTLVDYLPDLGAFFINTRSMTSLRDANGGILRGLLNLNPTSIPVDLGIDGLVPETSGPRG